MPLPHQGQAREKGESLTSCSPESTVAEARRGSWCSSHIHPQFRDPKPNHNLKAH
ncbi:hypothetical protein AAZX31_14G085400 [Glycine max]|uniref:Uncharacterized protein n=2 Tax=Glycine subgen. Soja TaxID=1462606 RepID=A0A0R0GAW4_SOYBN|nr:hypothetical protein JHK87_039178 [Glycine soja]KAG4962514.1 hypothetical protein JHK86_039382 [Glycine max]KAG5109981.1 hypothetical protein JHK82_039204 [Glycine max]KAH1093734.1 hypothetical protein GYH30_039457 [Glycine max]KRH15441.1 hypothetical protein GLYMA_14G088100v4 [Glycine max]